MLIRRLSMLFSALIFASAAQAHEFKVGDIQIVHPFARATVASQKSGSAYFSLENKGKENDKLMKATSDIAKTVEIHSMTLVADMMKMREVDSVEVKAGSTVNIKPGGQYHIMLIGLHKPLNIGDQFPMTLYFEKAGKVTVNVKVEASLHQKDGAAHKHPV